MNIWDWVIIAAVGVGVILAVIRMRKNRKAGKCPGGCECCGMPCAKKEQKNKMLDTAGEA